MSSNDVGSYELKRAPCEMQMEEFSANLARSTSDGSADLGGSFMCRRRRRETIWAAVLCVAGGGVRLFGYCGGVRLFWWQLYVSTAAA